MSEISKTNPRTIAQTLRGAVVVGAGALLVALTATMGNGPASLQAEGAHHAVVRAVHTEQDESDDAGEHGSTTATRTTPGTIRPAANPTVAQAPPAATSTVS